MSKIITKTNFRVVVEPKTHGFSIRYSDSTIESDCKEMVDQIKRHVDNVDRVYMDFDTEITCSYCGYEWELDKETGEPTCCNKAIDEHNSNLLTKQSKAPN